MILARALARSRNRLEDERGTTLIELFVSVAVMGIIATMFLKVMASVQSGVALEQERSQTVDQSRLAIEQMDREIRSGNIVYDPSLETSTSCGGYTCQPYYSLRVYTQANATTRVPPTQCVQWIIQNGKLLRRSWAAGAATSLNGWRVVAEGIVNRDVSPAVPAFSRGSSGRIVDITLLSNSRLSNTKSRTVRVEASIAIRNYSSGDPCTPIPAT